VVERDLRNSDRSDPERTELWPLDPRRPAPVDPPLDRSLLADEMPDEEAVDLAEVEEVQPSSFKSELVRVEQPATDCSGKFSSHSATIPPCPAPPKSVIPGYDWW
jgi:hypothetical protein